MTRYGLMMLMLIRVMLNLEDDGDKVDDEYDVVCDDDNDGCRFGQMQLVQEVVQQITGHAPVTYQLYFS